jgi:glycine/D-amino acid oxidase-like deaminating enzyme
LLLEGTAALDYVKSFIKSEAIECHLREAGRFRGASRPEHYEAMARDMDDLRAIVGVESHMVPRAEQRDEIGSVLYHGGCVLPGDASVHPALYHQGLLERAESAGVQTFSQARVTAIEETPQGLLVSTERGNVVAQDVLVATNGYTTKSTRELYERIVPVASAIIATSELSSNLMAHLMPKPRVFGDTLRAHHYYQPSPDGSRILFGGRLPGAAGTTNVADFAHLYKEMVDVFPELSEVSITHSWSGYVAFTRDTLPHIGQQGHVYHAIGYNGSGIARSSHAGHQVGLQMLGQRDQLSAWNELAFERFPFRSFASLGIKLAIAWKRAQDRRS